MAQAPLEALRLYGVAAAEGNHHDSLASGTTTVDFRALSAVVAAADYRRVSQSPEELAAHMDIVQEVSGQAAILPAPPGTVFRSKETLLRWLELHYFTLVEGLAQVDGHSAARVALTARELPEKPEDRKKLESVAADSVRALRGQAAATVAHAAPEGEIAEAAMATASFLVESARWDVFAATVEDEAKRHPEFEYDMTGPWPPYDFVQMRFGA